MPKRSGKLEFDRNRQYSFDFMGKDEYPVEYVGETMEGYGLFRKKEPHGGWSYWTDEVPPGLCVYDEGLDNPLATFEALEHLGEGKLHWERIGRALGYKTD